MITRRKFVQTSVAASAAALAGCFEDPPPPAAGQAGDAELRLFFVGGTVFVQDGSGLIGLQLSGKGLSHNGHRLEHASYLAGNTAEFNGGTPLPALRGAAAQRLPLTGFNAVCLVGKTVTVTGKNDKATNKCQRLANYGRVAAGKWTRKGDWDPSKNPAINSIFKLKDGDLTDGKAVNQTAEKVQWWVGGDSRNKKDLSDVAVLDVKAPTITIAGATASPIVVGQGRKLSLFVFSGPLEMHPQGHKYKTITHALLLKTIYDVKDTPDEHIMPTTEREIDGELGEPMDNPCDRKVRIRVPPDSEYCPNYDELP
ncbi:MAG TPA: hypothetical protein VFK57_00370 [Vicinamibacterales bacterium]|nr:hypothetical protein [Vicinamibacterales bacterium]